MFTGNEDQTISSSDASTYTASFRAWLASTHSPDTTIGEYFSRKTLQTILAEPNCVGARLYYGFDASGNRTLTIVGVTSDESDIVTGFIGDRSFKSPPHTGAANVLNS